MENVNVDLKPGKFLINVIPDYYGLKGGETKKYQSKTPKDIRYTIGEVVKSNNPRIEVGDIVFCINSFVVFFKEGDEIKEYMLIGEEEELLTIKKQ